MMGRILFYCCLACSLMYFTVGFTAAIPASLVRIGYEENLPMVGTSPDGKAQGIMVDVIEEVAMREGWNITYEPCQWKSCLANLESDKTDLLLAIAYTPERALRFDFNQHTVISNWGLIYSRPELHIETYNDLNGKRIAVVENDVYCNTFVKMIQEFAIHCDLVMAGTFAEIFAMIDRGEVDAGVANRFFSLLNERSFNVKATPILFSPVSVQVAAPKGRGRELLAAFDSHLEVMKIDRNSVYHQSLQRWLGIDGAGDHLPSWVWWLLSSILGGCVILGGFIFLLRREVKRKTANLLHEMMERRRSEEQLRLVLDNMREILIHASFDGTIYFVSSGIELLGYLPEELKGSPVQALCQFTQEYDQFLSKLQKENTLTGFRLLMVKKDGGKRLISINANILRNGSNVETSFIASGTDISEQARMEEILVQNEKMTMIGGLAAGMAHEINNPLGIILQHIQNVTRRISPELANNQEVASNLGFDFQLLQGYMEQREIPKFLFQIREAAERMSRIINNILKFSRKSTSKMESANLEMVIEQSLELAKNDYDLKKNYDFRNIDIDREYHPDLPKTELIVLEMEQVLVNLFKNAAQAMATCKNCKRPRLTLRTRKTEDWSIIEIEDNGPGMSEEVQERIFDPFFTTKETGVGTGLGLSVSYAIITNTHHGRFTVKSQPDRGTCFTICLPRRYASLGIM